MTSDDGNYSELLTDLSLIGLRNAQAKMKILLGVKSNTGIKARRVSTVDGLVDVLNRALAEKTTGKISGRQFKRIRSRVNAGIRALPLLTRSD